MGLNAEETDGSATELSNSIWHAAWVVCIGWLQHFFKCPKSALVRLIALNWNVKKDRLLPCEKGKDQLDQARDYFRSPANTREILAHANAPFRLRMRMFHETRYPVQFIRFDHRYLICSVRL